MNGRGTPLFPRLAVIAGAGLLAAGLARGSSCDLGRGLRAGTFAQ